jgi:ribosomal protein L37AE/L43A
VTEVIGTLIAIWLLWLLGRWIVSLFREKKYDIVLKSPCPRCWSDEVERYSTGYFTCGMCGARGRYPFVTASDVRRRLGGRPFYRKVERKK